MRYWPVLAVALAAMSASANAQRKNAPPIGNPASWLSSDDYPPDAMREGAEGRVVVTLAIDSTGAVSACAVKETSGNKSLDETTCRIAIERGRFTPATDGKGRPTCATHDLPVRWSLPQQVPGIETTKDAADVPAHLYATFEKNVSAGGIVASCQVVEQSKPALGAGFCDVTKPGDKDQIITRNGRPVSYTVRFRVSFDTTIAP